MRKNWQPKKLDELGFVGRGKSKHRPRNDPALYGGPYPFIQTGEIKEANLYLTRSAQTYNELGLSQSKLWPDGTLCITIAANIAETAILKMDACFPDSVVGFLPHPDRADVRFVKYSIDSIKQKMQNISHGTTQDNLSLKKLLTFDILTPPLLIQRQTAGILSIYDDLIENNTRRIALLEKMARALYKEWFAKFRFPGHEQARMVESAMGMVPQGWEAVKVKDIATVYRGRSYANENLVQADGLPFLNLKCIDRDGGFRHGGLKQYKGPYKDTQTATAGDIIMAVTDMTQERRIVARAARVPRNRTPRYVFSLDLVKIVPNHGISPEYLYGMLRFSEFADAVKQHANGANVLHLSPERIEQFSFLCAPESLREHFSRICRPLYDARDVLSLRNTNLRRTRDKLLPRLISGEIDVSSWIEGEGMEEVVAVAAHGSGMARETGPMARIDVGALERPELWE